MIMKHITYYYIISIGFVVMLHSLLNFPVNIISDLIGENEYIQHFCCISIASETIVCHAILLHLLGSSLDTHFRLTKPKWFSNTTDVSSRKYLLAIRLKIAAPWIVSILQTGAQILLSDSFPPAYLEEGRLCTSPDINFLILRTLVAFLLPLLTSIIILFMTAHRIQTLQCQQKQNKTNMNSFNIQQKKLNDTISSQVKKQSTCCLITSCINKYCQSRKHKVELIPLSYSNHHCSYDHKKNCNSLSRLKNFQPEYKTFHRIQNNKFIENRHSWIETNLNADEDILNSNLIIGEAIDNRTCIRKYSKSLSQKHLHSPVLLHMTPVSSLPTTLTTTSQYQHGSSSSDAGISSQTTEETDEIIQYSWFTPKINNYDIISTHSPNPINNFVSNNDDNVCPQEVLNNNHQIEKVNDNSFQKIIKHFCPQHGQVIIPECFYNPLLSVIEEIEPGQYDDQRTHEFTLQNNEVIPQSGQKKNNSLNIRNVRLPQSTNVTYASSFTSHIIFNKLSDLDKDNDLLSETCKQNNTLSQSRSNDQKQQQQHKESLNRRNSNSWSNETCKRFPEQKAIKLNMILCAITIAMWSPFITASLSHLLLSNSNYFHLLSIGTLIHFKWLAYMSSVVYPVGFLLVDSQLCRATFSQIYCRKF
ncbi:hypothetical protein MS3_00001640 [Schistosoma haematobium]|uniref:G-protein coupled receptors family 1 profile domain-containing protein n=1 Tax=Schistosoma haematobium TaxID=6185 RepID=A0A922LWY5_SCHHA|nr:hypothetical protein MS3_00001640 [Schistosoma haematobium]KAH9595679.1 hypothetical protein MS3_00001640 [Schistosoma haematobium]